MTPKILSLGLVGAMLCLHPEPRAAENKPPAADAKPTVSSPQLAPIGVGSTTNRAPWQQRLTLGPGDELSITLFGEKASVGPIPIGLDGRISFLQARDIYVAGLTVDELRAKLDQELSKYYLSAKTIVYPLAYRSKKYFMLGKIGRTGVYVLDRPKTVIEAVAQAGGLQIGSFEGNTVELTDLLRSFFIRGGKRLSVDFEALFLRADLSQNIPLEPDDYLYFASNDASEIYVLGEVVSPGIAVYAPDSSVLAVIASRGGFGPRAFKQRVLVLRGSLHNPTPFIVDVNAILKGRQVDFRLQPKDLVYVGPRPWYRAEELTTYAIDSFVNGAIYTWTRELVIKNTP